MSGRPSFTVGVGSVGFCSSVSGLGTVVIGSVPQIYLGQFCRVSDMVLTFKAVL